MLLDSHTIISNSCVGSAIFLAFYPEINPNFIEYTNPFIATLFVEDTDFVKLSLNYEKYMSSLPFFKDPRIDGLWFSQSKNSRLLSCSPSYPVMLLEDIEIHWAHDTSQSQILKKFIGRYELGKNLKRIFVWSAAEMFNLHTDIERRLLLKDFLSSPDKTIFLTNKKEEVFEDENHLSIFIPEWEGKDESERRLDFVPVWNNQIFVAKTLVTSIRNKFEV